MILAENKTGHQLLEYLPIPEKDLPSKEFFLSITSSFAFIKCHDKYLVAYNTLRKQWEFPAGKLETNESLKTCAIRELFEETGQKVDSLSFKGIFKIYDKNKNQMRYRAVYFAEVKNISKFIENDETSKILLWNLKTDIGYVDEVDLKMLKLSCNLNL